MKTMINPIDFSYLWDGSQPGWLLLRTNRANISITVSFSAGGPTLSEVAAMRKAVPTFSAMTPSSALASLKGQNKVPLGNFDSKEGLALANRCKQNGLTVELISTDKSGYLPMNEQNNQCLIIEDDILAEQVFQMAISQGIRVKHVEA